MFRRISLACALVASGAGMAACSSSNSSSSTTAAVTPVTKAGKLDCAKFSSAANKVTSIASQGASAQASVASELAIIVKLDAASAKAIGLLEPIAPDLVASWNRETTKSLDALKAAAAKGGAGAGAGLADRYNSPSVETFEKSLAARACKSLSESLDKSTLTCSTLRFKSCATAR